MTFKLILTTANSIIGVSILAMPYCFKECGIILAILLIVFCAYLVRMCCHLLVKSANLSHSRTYELLAFNTYGATGKFAVEFSMIVFLMGTCVAFFVVVGDLLPPFVADLLNYPDLEDGRDDLRRYVMFVIAVCIVLPLSLLRKLDSLSFICTISLIFYTGVTLYIMSTAKESVISGEWSKNVRLWRPAGIFKSLPIFCMGLSCQPQVFEVRAELLRKSESTQTPATTKMNKIIGSAVSVCALTYMTVGSFGYVALSGADLGGNILTAYEPSTFIKLIKIGFGVSVALSFPLVVFPCRTAIHSLLFPKPVYSAPLDMAGANYISPSRSNGITAGIIAITLIVGINTPDIEKVLGIVGSTIGNIVCILIPSVIFIKLTEKNTTERIGAKFVFVAGIVLMSLGTYVQTMEQQSYDTIAVKPILPNPKPLTDIDKPVKFPDPAIENPVPTQLPKLEDVEKKQPPVVPPVEEKRVEPVVPQAPDEVEPAAANVEKNPSNDNREAQLKVKEAKVDKILNDLEKQKEEHKQIIEEQKEVLDQMKQHLDEEAEAKKVIEPQVDKGKSNQIPGLVPTPGQKPQPDGIAQNKPLVADNVVEQDRVQGQETVPSLNQGKVVLEQPKQIPVKKMEAKPEVVPHDQNLILPPDSNQAPNLGNQAQQSVLLQQNQDNVVAETPIEQPGKINEQNRVINQQQQLNQRQMPISHGQQQQRPNPVQHNQAGQNALHHSGQVRYNQVPSNRNPQQQQQQFQGQNIMGQADWKYSQGGSQNGAVAPPAAAMSQFSGHQAPMIHQSNQLHPEDIAKNQAFPGQQQPSYNQDVIQSPILDKKNSQQIRAQKEIVEQNRHEDLGIKKDFKRDIPSLAPAQIGGRDLKFY